MELTWLGHSAFRLEADGKRIYIDPFLNGNPKCPEGEVTPERVDVNAHHSSSNNDLEYMGEPCGIVVRAEGKSVYFAGDMCVFGDMQLIGRLYSPDLAVLPIGDHYTMGPDEAALALELLGVKRCLPCHWGTFPPLVGRPETLQQLAPDVKVEMLEPGDSVTV